MCGGQPCGAAAERYRISDSTKGSPVGRHVWEAALCVWGEGLINPMFGRRPEVEKAPYP